MPVLIAAATLVSTTLGGVFALRHRDRLHLILGFSAGVLLGVVAFDLLPEIFELAADTSTSTDLAMAALVIAFLVFHVAEKTVLIHAAHEDEYGGTDSHHHHQNLGLVSASALCLHSLIDGIAIGIAFKPVRRLVLRWRSRSSRTTSPMASTPSASC